MKQRADGLPAQCLALGQPQLSAGARQGQAGYVAVISIGAAPCGGDFTLTLRPELSTK